jgi:hypothetical protein
MLTLRRTLGAVAVGIALTAHAQAQAIRHFTPVEDLRIGAQAMGGQRDFNVLLAPNGRIIVAPRFGMMPIVAFDSLGNRLPWKVATGGGDADIGFVDRLGVIAGTNTVWVADQRFGQVALVDSTGKVFKSIENPSWIHPSWSERRNYPVFASMAAFALYKDESMLVVPGRERALLNTPGYDRTGEHLLRMTWSGAIQRTVAMFPGSKNAVEFRGNGCNHVAAIPFGSRAEWAVSSDGSRLVMVTAGVTPADSGTVRITAMGERGDTVFSRTIAQPAVRIPPQAIDNVLANQRACGSYSLEAVRDSITRRIGAFRSYLRSVLVGRDQTVWVTLRALPDTSMERTAIGLDERGDVIGEVALPINQNFVGADRTHIWMVEGGRPRAPASLIRYRLDATPAQPPRSARGASPSSTAKPPG